MELKLLESLSRLINFIAAIISRNGDSFTVDQPNEAICEDDDGDDPAEADQ